MIGGGGQLGGMGGMGGTISRGASLDEARNATRAVHADEVSKNLAAAGSASGQAGASSRFANDGLAVNKAAEMGTSASQVAQGRAGTVNAGTLAASGNPAAQANGNASAAQPAAGSSPATPGLSPVAVRGSGSGSVEGNADASGVRGLGGAALGGGRAVSAAVYQGARTQADNTRAYAASSTANTISTARAAGRGVAGGAKGAGAAAFEGSASGSLQVGASGAAGGSAGAESVRK